MRAWAKKSIDWEKDVGELDEEEQDEQQKQLKAIKCYNKNIREKSCDDITGMLPEGDEDWVQGESQDMHKKFMRVRGYDE